MLKFRTRLWKIGETKGGSKRFVIKIPPEYQGDFNDDTIYEVTVKPVGRRKNLEEILKEARGGRLENMD